MNTVSLPVTFAPAPSLAVPETSTSGAAEGAAGAIRGAVLEAITAGVAESTHCCSIEREAD